MRRAFGVARLIAAAAGYFTLIAFLVYTLGVSGPVFANFVSYFTVQSAIAAVIVWTAAGVIAIRQEADPAWLGTARLMVTTFQVVSGIIFTIIRIEAVSRDVRLGTPWSSDALHYWLPAFAVLDWLLAPGRRRLRWQSLPLVLVFPSLWGAYTVIRGAILGWYPYFFLDAAQVSTAESFWYCTIAGALILGVSALLLLLSRLIVPSWMRHQSSG